MSPSFRNPQYCGMPKIHRHKTLVRHLVSQYGSLLLSIASTYLGYKNQPFIATIPNYVKDSHDVLLRLKNLGRVPYYGRIFTSDTISMYTCIEPDEGIKTVETTSTTSLLR